MTPIQFERATAMSHRRLQAGALVLLLSMALAAAAGLAAWGPVHVGEHDHLYANAWKWGRAPQTLNVLACLPLLAAAAWALRPLRLSTWSHCVVWPWRVFLVLAALLSAGAGLYHLQPGDAGYVLVHTMTAAAFVTLLLGFLAERVDARWGSTFAVAVGVGVAAGAGLYWLAGEWSSGLGDLRAVLFLQGLPILLIPAGALSLPGRFTTTGDWLWMLGIYVSARAAGVADGWIVAASTWISGHMLMHLLLTGIALRLAYRAACSPAMARSGAATESTQRNTSLNTSA
jgi:hypothetical protein